MNTSTTFSQTDDVDFVIIGTGAAGGIIAKELAIAGFKVVALERGPYLTERDFSHDELKFRITDGGGLVSDDFRLFPQTFRKTESETARPKPSVLYGSVVGGGSVAFTANYWRYHEVDFEERSRLGSIPNTGFADWPITYAELEPYYTKAEWELGISGEAGASPFDPPRSKPYPLPALPVKSAGVLLERAARRLGWHPFPAPMAVLSRPYRDRAPCIHCGFCEMFGCEVKAKSSTLVTVIPEAERTGNCEVRPNSYVSRIETDRQGKVTGVTYFDADRHEQVQRAKAVVLSANGAETPRLLLMSESAAFPDGLANSSGLVGKYLMFGATTELAGLFEHPLNEYKSVAVTRVVHDFYDADPRRGFYGGGGLDTRGPRFPISFAFGGLPPDVPNWGTEYKAMLSEYFTRTMRVVSHTTALPLESNGISLDPQWKDDWGLPAIRVTYKNHPDDLETMRFFLERSREILETAGAKRIWGVDVAEVEYSAHLMGTCRMGDDAQTSVVDKYHRTHDVRNLFICDGSSFVTSGRNQPTCTIQALAYRAADHMIQFARRGEI